MASGSSIQTQDLTDRHRPAGARIVIGYQSLKNRLAVLVELQPSAVLALTILAHSMEQVEEPNDEIDII